MPTPSYDPVLAGSVWEAFRTFSRRRQRKLAEFIHLLAEQPFRVGDYQTNDQAGRPLENVRFDDVIITYWADHSAHELRIVDLVEL